MYNDDMDIIRVLGWIARYGGKAIVKQVVTFLLSLLGLGFFWAAIANLDISSSLLIVAIVLLLIILIVQTAIVWFPSHLTKSQYQGLEARNRYVFSEIANEISRRKNVEPGVVLQKLVCALWRGEFEDSNGESSIVLPTSEGTMYPHDGSPVPTDGHGNLTIKKDMEWSRRLMLSVLDVKVPIRVPKKSDLVPPNGEPLPWKKLEPQADLEILESLNLDNYSEMYKKAYLQPLVMPKRDFLRWLMLYESGRFE